MTIGSCILGALLRCGFPSALASPCRGDQGSMFAVVRKAAPCEHAVVPDLGGPVSSLWVWEPERRAWQ